MHSVNSFIAGLRRFNTSSKVLTALVGISDKEIGLAEGITQKGHPFGWPFYLFDVWQFPTLTWGDPTLPSALRRFTSEFGMGSGGTTALKPPGKFC